MELWWQQYPTLNMPSWYINYTVSPVPDSFFYRGDTMEFKEFHNHTGPADKARLNLAKDWDMPKRVSEDTDSGGAKQVYNFNRVKGDFF